MQRYLPTITFLCVFNACSTPGAEQAALPEVVDFNFHVKPILSDRCFKCHGPDANTREAELRLDTPEGAFARLYEDSTRFVIVPGSPEESEVFVRITHPDPEERMPHPDSKLFLSENEIALIERWIEQGAEWKEHWAFTPPAKAELPEVENTTWPRSELDYFVLARLEREGLSPAPEEAREKWLRRVSFDLTGLPPSLDDLEAFLSDESEDAYEKVVDRLLASRAYGERMAVVWLDAARYADSHGYQDDRPRTMWPWRDWVIDAYNRNLPYDEFITWQLAGDLLPDATYEQKLATGFNRNHGITQEGGVVNEEYITEYVADRTNTMSTAFLGVTMECARCHDHKYDPISQSDYFGLFAFFNGIDERGQISYFDLAPTPNMRVENDALEAEIETLEVETLEAEAALAELSTPGPAFEAWTNETLDPAHLDASLHEGLETHYLFDELIGGVTPDEIDGEKPGRINTRLFGVLASPETVPGRAGNALAFDGENYLNIGDVGDFEHADRFSMGAWIKAGASREKDASILVKRNEEQKRGGYQLLLTTDNRLKAGLIHDQNKERIEVRTRAAVPADTWSHVFATYDGSGKASGLRLYVDGVQQPVVVEEDSLARRSILNGNDVLVGNWTTRNTPHGRLFGFLEGAVDDVRIYRRELAPVEVETLAGRRPLERYETLSAAGKKAYANDALLPYYLNRYDTAFAAARARVDSLRGIHIEVPYVMIMEEMETPRTTYVLARGAYDAPTDSIGPGTPAKILPFPETYPKNRLGLAKWLVHPENPLTARVAVNRMWQVLFGRGIVATPEDFGSQGALPSHPAMLDWLAVTFRESGWDVKAIMKTIVLSATYRQAASITPEKRRRDPQNMLLARGPAQRFSSEMVRDNALKVSGLLKEKEGGRWVKPYQPAGVWKELANQIGENKYRPSRGDDLYRRSIYSYWKRTIPPPAMLTFDAAERTVCVVKRPATSTPLQALILLNDPQIIEASRKLAERAMRVEADAEARLTRAFRWMTSRLPDQHELQLLTRLLEDERTRFETDAESASELLSVGVQAVPVDLDRAELAAYTVVVNTMFNLDEAKMRS